MVGLSEEYRVMFEGGVAIADECLARAVRSIDMRFGQGYAKAHPELVATYMQVAAQEYDTASSQKRQIDLVHGALNRISILVDNILDNVSDSEGIRKEEIIGILHARCGLTNPRRHTRWICQSNGSR